MAPTHLKKIKDLLREINTKGTIPFEHRETLNDRLRITFKSSENNPRQATRQSNAEYSRRFREKHARPVYLEVLEKDVSLFLPFVIKISPTICSKLDLSTLLQEYMKLDQPLRELHLNHSAKEFLSAIAKEHDFEQNEQYKKLSSSLFARLSSQHSDTESAESISRPIGALESVDRFSYLGADPAAVLQVYGARVYEFVEQAPAWIQERAVFARLTECVQAAFALDYLIDGVFNLQIGAADKIAAILYPNIKLDISTNYASDSVKDDAYFTLIGASIKAIKSFFPKDLCDAIEASDLRDWEKTHFLLESTDCVVTHISRTKPHIGTISIRVGYALGVLLLNKLYGVF
ncbi:hypothetical protein PV08_08997 [Exophiala spinifera]|uniref:Uncharacterized protein n=1 Tax=Exophiala spinifera TaxID=91928 RepID=A0A0D2B529_9EURO|nr:uncharacterized protein PV08_08997 [Exophiala spinifera]KIW13805.1 hypothetical protein PV08_08997 [Exophiala spinifera]